MEKPMELLQILASHMHCQYLSDLRFSLRKDELRAAVQELSETEFTLEDYNDAANYILHREGSYPTIAAAKQAILDGLSGM